MKKKKGKIRKENRYLSIVLVPHSSGKVRTLKISNYFPKLIALYTISFVIILSVTLFVTYTVYQNKTLKTSLSGLQDSAISQQKLLAEKANEIAEFKQKESDIQTYINDFTNKFSQVTSTYIENSSKNLTVSRSSQRTDSSFVSDITELRVLLTYLEKTNSEKDDLLVDLSETEENLRNFLNSLPTSWPVDAEISSPFGYRNHPVYGTELFHSGLDLGADYGDTIRAAGDGKVIFSGTKSGYGNCIIIDHGNNLCSLYGHCSKLLINKVGTNIKRGDSIARVGSTGTSTGPHLHFEIQVSGTAVDPLKYLDKR